MTEADLTCRELVEIVTDYFEGRLPRRDRIRLEEHILICEGCATYLEQMRETIRLTGALRTSDVPAEVEKELVRAFRGWKGS
ncbi:MAG: anti-sigma factor family protein [Gaiellaceae bacterium]